MNTNKSDFYIAREMFADYVAYDSPLSYEEWLEVADDLKAAVLFCQFFDQITLAWYKLKSSYSTEADGVDEVLQYLQKNVDVIKNDKKRFNAAYVYRVVSNCLLCLCTDPNKYRKVFDHEVSNIQMSADGEFDIYDISPDTNHTIENGLARAEEDRLWNVIESRGRKTIIVVAELLGEEYDWTDEDADFPKANEPWRLKWKNHKCKADKYTMNHLRKCTNLPEGEEGRVELISTEDLGNDTYQVEYREYTKDTYKGAKKFTKADHESVSAEERDEIMSFLRDLFGEYREAFAF